MTQSSRSQYDYLTYDFIVKSIALITLGTGEEEYEILVGRCRCAADSASLYRRYIFVLVLQFRWIPLRDLSNCCRCIVLRLLYVRAAFCFVLVLRSKDKLTLPALFLGGVIAGLLFHVFWSILSDFEFAFRWEYFQVVIVMTALSVGVALVFGLIAKARIS